MKSTTLYSIIFFSSAFLLLSACSQNNQQEVSDGWLTGSDQERFDKVASHLGGFSKAMWEVDYRFHELYWAGNDMNWEYALHQALEMGETIANGLERRPERAASAQQFISSALPGIEKAFLAEDPEMFERNFQLLMSSCNSCHALEEMPFLTVKTPLERRSSIR
ncbi:MAG: hypothetical protein ACFCUM_18640 [Bacteroidales bacterium]